MTTMLFFKRPYPISPVFHFDFELFWNYLGILYTVCLLSVWQGLFSVCLCVHLLFLLPEIVNNKYEYIELKVKSKLTCLWTLQHGLADACFWTSWTPAWSSGQSPPPALSSLSATGTGCGRTSLSARFATSPWNSTKFPLRPRLCAAEGIYVGRGISRPRRAVFRAAFRPRCSGLSAKETGVSGDYAAKSCATPAVGRVLWSGRDGTPRLPSPWARSRSCAGARRPATTTEIWRGVPHCRSSAELRRRMPPSNQTRHMCSETMKNYLI